MSFTSKPNPDPPTPQSHAATFLPPPRQIRFVATDGQPHTKRRRINAACLTCRKRKTRCSGERPECRTCADNGHVCSGYNERPGRKDSDSRAADDDAAAAVVEEDGTSGSSTPRKQPRESDASAAPPPKIKQQDAAEFSLSLRVGDRDETGSIVSPGSNHTSSSVTTSRTRVPYFRYFGPTAIVPGFKQMVVQVKDHRRSLPSNSEESPASGGPHESNPSSIRDIPPFEIPFYDATDPDPNPALITHLCETFFSHLGCNYPFLQRQRFMRDLEDKRVDAVLVDAVCAVAARFSSDPLLSRSSDPSLPLDSEGNVKRAFRGHPFFQRATSNIVGTFSYPTMAVAQACLLLAYEEFGTDHDSGLWMFLGTAIRMAQDLGIQKLEGLQLEGRLGPTPGTAKNGHEGKAEERRRSEQQQKLIENLTSRDPGASWEDRKASELERIDTFYAIFFLDRAVSSGVGRPVTLRDKDIEISFPYRPDDSLVNGYPDPFPAMIKIVHMYGRVADVLNNIIEVSQVTPDVLKRLASMEKDLTGIYQRMSPKLYFNATNFQHYVKAGHGTNFILLHFWFHTLIVLLHQPTLLHSFEGRIQQLFPDSRELAISSAKTIADILAFAELIDVKSFIGNPFTSQPMYVAACAFLAEAAAHASQPSSRAPSPPPNGTAPKGRSEASSKRAHADLKAASARHTLLATAANENYQKCYRALQTLGSYWAGCRYILTALDQKSKGLMDPLLFTAEDVDGEMPSTEPNFTTPGWRRSTSLTSSLGGYRLKALGEAMSSSPKIDWTQAIGWSLTGTASSPAPNLSFLYPHASGGGGSQTSPTAKYRRAPEPPQQQLHVDSGLPAQRARNVHHDRPIKMEQLQSYGTPSVPADRARLSSLPYDPVSTAEADLLLGLHSPYASSSTPQNLLASGSAQQTPSSVFEYTPQPGPVRQQFMEMPNQTFNNMMIESQDIDMSGQNLQFNFPGGDMIPWLEYLPQDVLNYFGDPQNEAEGMMPPGPGPPQPG